MADHTDTLHQLRAMALIATLRTAAEARHAIAERRAGRDPSGQEDAAPVRAYLRGAREELGGLVTRLRVSLAVGRADEAALVQAFEDRMLLARAGRVLYVVHQRLLSLYPEVPEGLIEDARRVQAEAARTVELGEGAFQEAVGAWLPAAAGFLQDLAGALSTPN